VLFSKLTEGHNIYFYQLPKGGAGIDALIKGERPNPNAAYHQVLVKVAACSLNYRDLGIVRGSYRLTIARAYRTLIYHGGIDAEV
jgi:NADPH:quinone reductase-like Zn-dependent oxidoreductase